MTDQEYEEMYQESLTRLDAYIATQVTEKQIFDAKHQKKHIEMNKSYFKHWANKGDHICLCVKCGALNTASYSSPIKERMILNKICFHCDFWEELSKENKPSRLVIDGHIYGDGGNKPNERKDWLGFGGHVWKIERDGKVWTTNNLWSGSTVPAEWVHAFPDNAKFIK